MSLVVPFLPFSMRTGHTDTVKNCLYSRIWRCGAALRCRATAAKDARSSLTPLPLFSQLLDLLLELRDLVVFLRVVRGLVALGFGRVLTVTGGTSL